MTRFDTPGYDELIRTLAACLEPSDTTALSTGGVDPAAWSAAAWRALPRAITIHGLGPRLARDLPASIGAVAPAGLRAWLDEQAQRNAVRIARMHDDLAAILAAADRAGVPIVLLKGAVLTTLDDADRHPRPMADLDLLVRPADRERMGRLLAEVGFRDEPEHTPRPSHDVYVDSGGGGRIVDRTGEHPDNPRRVEVHVEVKRHLWGWVDDDDLTAGLWRDASETTVVGERALVPGPTAMLAHLAIHASSDLLVARGRLVQWPDLWRIAQRGEGSPTLPHPGVAYPALALAARAMPTAAAGFDLGPLAARVPARLVRWATTVPLDTRAGLTAGRAPDRPAALAARWERWKPLPWRLAAAYGEVPLPLALARYGSTAVRRIQERRR